MKTLIIVLISIIALIGIVVLLFRFGSFLFFLFMSPEKIENLIIQDYERLTKEGTHLSDKELECLKDMSINFKEQWKTKEDETEALKKEKIAYWDKVHQDAIKEIKRRYYWRQTCK